MFPIHVFTPGSCYPTVLPSFEGQGAHGRASSAASSPARVQGVPKACSQEGKLGTNGTSQRWKMLLSPKLEFLYFHSPRCPRRSAERGAELCCHTLLPHMMGPDHHISSCCEVLQPSPMETRDVTKSQRWCEDTVLTAGLRQRCWLSVKG